MNAAADISAHFIASMQAAGVSINEATLRFDGAIHRFATEGDKGNKRSGWYYAHGGENPHVTFGSWKDGSKFTEYLRDQRSLSNEERARHAAWMAIESARRHAEEVARQNKACANANRLWPRCVKDASNHAYIVRKGIGAYRIRQYKGALVIPLVESGKIHSLQFIWPDGTKRFLTGGRITGCYFRIGGDITDVLCIAEGFATAASIHEATGHPLVISFNAGNLPAVAAAMHKTYPEARIVICADNDTHGKGEAKANEAARLCGGCVALPPSIGDFNDMAQTKGADAVARCIDTALKAGILKTLSGAETWPEPKPLATNIERMPYPRRFLPDIIREAVNEVERFVQAPYAMVACAALAAVSLAVQARIDVSRAETLSGPCGIYILLIADSGERKSSCGWYFFQGIREFEKAQRDAAADAVKEYRAEHDIWESKKQGIRDAIRAKSKNAGKPDNVTAEDEHALRELEKNEPKPVRFAQLIREDATPEALLSVLRTQWPSAGIVSSEGGQVLGSHGMNPESIMRNLATLNSLWDGASIQVDRKTSESFKLHGARLSCFLQVQEPTLRSFLDKAGTLARGSGFLARFLIAWPESTQGKRLFVEPTQNMPCLSRFNNRLTEILKQPVSIDDTGALSPSMLALSPAAKNAWITLHNGIERELGEGGDYRDVRDVASKIAENAARLAALLHVFDGLSGPIGEEHVFRAGSIVTWHLNESRRFFGEMALPESLADSVRLDTWLVDRCSKQGSNRVAKNDALQRGPQRKAAALDQAIAHLVELDRLRVAQEGKARFLVVNPALLAAAAPDVGSERDE
jgi:putative DNA primase/helicase